MSNPFLAEITMFGGTFAPRGWAFCDGQLLAISQNQALFSLLSTTYGGDGRTTFGLPDLRGRAPIHPGTGAGLSNVRWGQKLGAQTQTLTTAQLPSHDHTLRAYNTAAGNKDLPTGNVLATHGDATPPSGPYIPGQAANVSMAAGSITNTGGSQSFSIQQPSLCVNFIIATRGIYPPRN